MTDLTRTIAPKSDQLNADDLIAGPQTIQVTSVSLMEAADQPIAINFQGDNGKPYKPCKSMRRVMVHLWGGDGNAYVGRRMTLYRDDKVQFGGTAVGGIRISHMSDIAKDVTLALTATRASRKPYTVKPLLNAAPAAFVAPQPQVDVEAIFAAAKEACEDGRVAWGLWWRDASKEMREAIRLRLPELQAILKAGEVDDDPLAGRLVDDDGRSEAAA